jgi:hypothetical protein
MSRSRWAVLALIGLASAAAAGSLVGAPGYMDADYYYATGLQLVGGWGFTEPFLWNYLDDPQGIPHPSHLYWMPAPSLLAAGAMAVFGRGFRQAQLPFLLLTATLPVLTAGIALHLGSGPRRAWLAGWLAAVPGFFLPFFATTDTFAPFAVAGALSLWSMATAASRPSAARWLAAGALVAVCHLTRADGVLLLLPAALAVCTADGRRLSGLWLPIGYAAVMAPWWLRNLAALGSPLPPGAGRTLWLLAYDELYTYPASLLTPVRWWSSGLGAILEARLDALWSNLQTLVAVDGLVFLGPLALVGAWGLRRNRLVRLSVVYLVVLLCVMSFVFPFAGIRGGFFHSSAALMPILWALVAAGLDDALDWAAPRRGWARERAGRVFGITAVAMATALTGVLGWTRAVGPNPEQPRWSASQQTYQEIGERLRALDPSPGIVAINNPPGLSVAAALPSVVVPNGDERTLREVVERYGVRWVILDANQPMGLAALYEHPAGAGWLTLQETLLDGEGRPVYLLSVEPAGGQP